MEKRVRQGITFTLPEQWSCHNKTSPEQGAHGATDVPSPIVMSTPLSDLAKFFIHPDVVMCSGDLFHLEIVSRQQLDNDRSFRPCIYHPSTPLQCTDFTLDLQGSPHEPHPHPLSACDISSSSIQNSHVTH